MNNTDSFYTLSCGEPGKVKLVFDSLDKKRVYKVIKDSFADCKYISHERIEASYQTMNRLRDRFYSSKWRKIPILKMNITTIEPKLYSLLINECKNVVIQTNDELVLRDVIEEKRYTPLNVLIKNSNDAMKENLAIRLGKVIKSLAQDGVFLKELTIKNFGYDLDSDDVVLYDFDEITDISQITFSDSSGVTKEEAIKKMLIGDGHFYPEIAGQYLHNDPVFINAFWEFHGELFSTTYWNEVKSNQRPF
jgi:isocitrate dehydrogenase kinase/phosphatase